MHRRLIRHVHLDRGFEPVQEEMGEVVRFSRTHWNVDNVNGGVNWLRALNVGAALNRQHFNKKFKFEAVQLLELGQKPAIRLVLGGHPAQPPVQMASRTEQSW